MPGLRTIGRRLTAGVGLVVALSGLAGVFGIRSATTMSHGFDGLFASAADESRASAAIRSDVLHMQRHLKDAALAADAAASARELARADSSWTEAWDELETLQASWHGHPSVVQSVRDDLEVSLRGVSVADVEALVPLGPFGTANPEPVLILRGKADTPASAMAAHPILKAFGALSLLGILLFGAAAFQIGYYPAWTPIVFVVGSLVTLGVIATGRSMTIAILANFAVSLALFAMSWQVVV